jgi:hypothetical protein
MMHLIDTRKNQVEYKLRVTCVEIYNEQVKDLFDPKKESLAVRWTKEHGFYLENATVIEVTSVKELIRVAKAAATNRCKSSHLLNDKSNRSHCLLTIYIDATPFSEQEIKKYGKLTIVDLAGSERANVSPSIYTFSNLFFLQSIDRIQEQLEPN